jgi:hypothetical protein
VITINAVTFARLGSVPGFAAIAPETVQQELNHVTLAVVRRWHMGENKQLHTNAISTQTWAKAGLKERLFCARGSVRLRNPVTTPTRGRHDFPIRGQWMSHRFGWRFNFHGVFCPAHHLNFHGH